MQFWAIITDSLRESLDRKIFWVMVVITLLVGLVMACVGFHESTVSLLFGLFEVDTEEWSPYLAVGKSRILSFAVYYIVDLVLGSVGMILMLIATAGFVPNMLQSGSIDVILA